MTDNKNRRRSMSVSASPYLSQSDTTSSISSSLWNNNTPKSYFLSRFRSTTPPVTPSTSTSSSFTALPPIQGQQNIKRKPLVTPTTNTIGRKKYEAVLGIKADELLLENASSKKKSNRFVGNLFKKKSPRSRSVEKKAVEPLITTTKPLTPPPIQIATPVHQPPKNLPDYKPQYHQVKEQSPVVEPRPTYTQRLSNASTRKSTGSNSIYSTFGPEVVFEDASSSDDITTPTDKIPTGEKESGAVDLVQIVANNVQTRNPARIVVAEDMSSSEEEDDDGEEEEDDLETEGDESTELSPEDLERERIEARLSKRLSGGHFGSAGGLMMSIIAPSADNSTERKQKRSSRPPPEDVVQSMMNWKRQSGQGIAKFIMEQQQTEKNELPPPPPLPKKEIPVPEIVLPTTVEVDDEAEEAITLDSNILSEASYNSQTDDDPKDCAARLWHEDETFVQRERIAEWLGQSKTLNIDTLKEYMAYFDFATMRLDGAFRKVCSKLYFRAEAQQIDRILEAFANRYWHCNPQTIFGNADTVYAVVYSLLLLNTDLHVAQGSYTRMTRHAFVRNTMSTIMEQQKADPKLNKKSPHLMLAWEAHIEAYLKDMYLSVKHYQILQPMQNGAADINSDFLTPTPTVSKRMSMIGGKRMIDIKRNLNSMIHKSTSSTARESMLFLEDPSPRKSTSSSSQSLNYPPRRGSISSAHSGTKINPVTSGALLSPNQSHMMSFMDTHSADLFANRPPYLKEGVVMRKHLLESANQKAKHREWRECLLVVGQGELKMYGFQSDNDGNSTVGRRNNVMRASSASFANLADSFGKNNSTNSSMTNITSSFSGVSQNSNQRWASYSQLLGTVRLNHSLSNALPPPGYNRTRPHVFAIQEPNGGVLLIQATSQEQVNEWVSTCNYWAARQSKEPLQGGVSNAEYGWGSCLDDVILDLDAVESGKKITGKYFRDPDTVNITSWVPPAPTMVSSILDEKTHFDNLQLYLVSLNQEINDHREVKKKLLVKFPNKSQNHSKALANWEAKSKYMLHDIIKYQNYCDVLEKSIQRREQENTEKA